jgi:hypothetical protein
VGAARQLLRNANKSVFVYGCECDCEILVALALLKKG